MLLSHNYKFIFIKTKKTAGTSIEISLSRYCNHPNDIITPISKEDEKIREKLGIVPKNFRGRKFRNHMTAEEIKQKIEPQQWKNFRKFCFVRNPWDALVSMYYYRLKRDNEQRSFPAFVKSFKRFNNYQQYTDREGNIIVDFIGKYENLLKDLNTVCRRLELPFDGWLPKAKGDLREENSYQEFYNEELKRFVSRRFKKEICYFNYKF